MTSVGTNFCTVIDFKEDGEHQWAVVRESCDLSDLNDTLLAFTAQAIRNAYGEEELKAMAEDAVSLLELPTPADTVSSHFSLDDLLMAFRSSLPNPSAEGLKPAPLSNYRSETAEILAREALSHVFKMATPPSLHATKGNRNQPVLGFDGWSVMSLGNGALALVLIQVKATDDIKRPPGEAKKLIGECSKAPVEIERLKGFLSACAVRCKGTTFTAPLLSMLAQIQNDNSAKDLIVAPVIIRGMVTSHHDDLSSLVAAKSSFAGAKSRGLSLSIGADLNDFGRRAMNLARQS